MMVAGRAGRGHVSGPWPWPWSGVCPDLRSQDSDRKQQTVGRRRSSGTDVAGAAKCTGRRRQPCGMGGIPLRFLFNLLCLVPADEIPGGPRGLKPQAPPTCSLLYTYCEKVPGYPLRSCRGPRARPVLGSHPSPPSQSSPALTAPAWRNRCFALRNAHPAGECPDSSGMSDLVTVEFSGVETGLLPTESLFLVGCVWQEGKNSAIRRTRAIRETFLSSVDVVYQAVGHPPPGTLLNPSTRSSSEEIK